ncbi:hypothetical protein [Streptomyces sp. NBC_01500]|uniref:hypothetical protein n=1 Tax=Streptomyces sp. NBC_01500 TaxID=2903886 RepID=UPI00225908AF|nr:hypothetical protein [Streptomyces sp. NBC_01500]MCX4554234.1 hypothetical protein [Streptomyces sp. NBC_01500]
MSVILVASAHGSGATVTSLALALAGPRPSLLVEADAHQGSIRTGYRQGQWGGEVGLWHLAQAQFQHQLPDAFEAHLRTLDLDGNRLILPGLTDPTQAPALAGVWEPLALLMQAMDQHAGYDVVIDAGRVTVEPGRIHPVLFPAPLAYRADAVVLVVRNSLTSVAQTLPVVRALQNDLERSGSGAEALRLLLVQELPANRGGLRSDAIARRLRAPVVDILPWDPAAGSLLTHGSPQPVRLAKLALIKQARKTAQLLAVEASNRRRALDMPAATVTSPDVAGVLQRLSAAHPALGPVAGGTR